jgi:hypothetical protein
MAGHLASLASFLSGSLPVSALNCVLRVRVLQMGFNITNDLSCIRRNSIKATPQKNNVTAQVLQKSPFSFKYK